MHVGANVGEEARVYNELGIKKVIWFEANENLFTKLLNNIRIFPEQTAMCYCVGDEDDKSVNLHIANNAGQSSSILQLGTHKIQHPDVHFTHDVEMKTKRIDTLYNGNFPADIDFLNIDIQGAELMALRGMGDLIRQFKWAYIEVNQNEVYQGCPHVSDIDLFLNGFGFKRVETKWCGNWGDALYIKGK